MNFQTVCWLIAAILLPIGMAINTSLAMRD